ncbi:hypothetical protein VTN00DRAFT_3136 [Thermoascus crustaceus]|uniref:uncharacterized protein n=1 Tax=Thermoascus crustaceus TaxID=5088 RepID=UPI003742D467
MKVKDYIHHHVLDTLKEKIKTTNIKLKPKKKKKGKSKKDKNKDKGHNDDPIKNETANASASSSPIYSTSASTSTSTIAASPSPTATITPYTNRFSTSTILQPPQPHQPTGPFPFLRLPRELRDRIYEELLTRQDHDELWIRYSQSRKTWWDATKFCLCYRRPGQDVFSTRTPPALEVAILRTCRMVYEEASAILYGVGRYHDHDHCREDVDVEGRRGRRRKGYQIWLDAPPLQALEFLSTRLLPSSRSSIRFLKLWMDPYLDCHHATGGLDQLPPWKLVIQKSRVRHELLDPWKALMMFLGDERSMPKLSTLCVSINAQRSWHAANVGLVDRNWQYFYRRGWMEMLVPSSRSDNSGPEDGSASGTRSGVPFCALETLLVEGRRFSFEAPVKPDELSSFHELRDDLAQATAGHFVEESARWVSYMCGAGGFDPIEVPNSMLCLSLKKRKTGRECVEVDEDEDADVDVDDDAEPESRPVSSTSTATSPPSTSVAQKPPLRPLEEFRQEFSWEDAYMPVVCTFATSLPPRSPDNTR